MSRYIEDDLKGLKRAELLRLVARQPNVDIPRRFSTQPPAKLTNDKLRKLLLAPFGFVKEEPIRLSYLSEGGQCMEQTSVPEPPEAIEEHTQIQEDVAMREPLGAELIQSRFQTGKVGLAGETEGFAQPLFDIVFFHSDLADLIRIHKAGHIGPKCYDQRTSDHPVTHRGSGVRYFALYYYLDRAPIDYEIDCKDSLENYSTAVYRQGACEVTGLPSTLTPRNSNATVIAVSKKQLDSLIWMGDSDEYQPTASSQSSQLPSALRMALASLPPDVSTMVEEYFLVQPEDIIAWQTIHSARKKKKPDFAVVQYFRQVLALYTKLKNHQWPNDAGTLRSKDLVQIIGFSSAWFTNARQVLDEYDQIGPYSGRANAAIITRFQGRAATKKCSDLLKFLRTQRKIIEGGVV